jgi:site-specific recombinase XerD
MEDITTTQTFALYERALLGNNYSEKTSRAYTDDLRQFVSWVKSSRVDWDNPRYFTRIDLVELLNHLAALNTTGVTRVRKLAALRNFFTFMKENGIIAGNPAETVKSPHKEEKEPNILHKNEYKALLFEAQGNSRDYAMMQIFLQTGLRVSELVNLTLDDLDIENRTLTVRQGKGKRDRTIALEEQALTALKKYLKDRNAIDGCNNVFIARNGTSMDVRTVRYVVQKYMKLAGIRKKASVHTLRHTFGTHKVDKGMTIPALQELLGHRKMETTYKYVHLAKTSLREQQERTGL